MEKFLLLLFTVTLVGCLETKHLRNLPDRSGSQAEKLTPTDFVFSKVNQQVFSKKCVGCHREGKMGPDGLPTPELDNPGSVNLQTYENTKRMIKYIKDVVETGVMGFESAPALTDLEKQLVLGWIELGAPE